MTALIEAIYDMVNQNQAVCRVLILENTNSTVLMRMIALAKDNSIAYWRKELPNASETDLEMMYTHLPNGMMHIVVEGYGKYSKDEIIRFVSHWWKASSFVSNRPKDLLLNIDLMLEWYNNLCKIVDGQRKGWGRL